MTAVPIAVTRILILIVTAPVLARIRSSERGHLILLTTFFHIQEEVFQSVGRLLGFFDDGFLHRHFLDGSGLLRGGGSLDGERHRRVSGSFLGTRQRNRQDRNGLDGEQRGDAHSGARAFPRLKGGHTEGKRAK